MRKTDKRKYLDTLSCSYTGFVNKIVFFFNFRKCASILRINIYFCVFRFKRIHTCQKILSRNRFFIYCHNFLFTSTQVKKWTGNVPSLHIIGLDRPQMITTSTVTLHPKKQDAKEHCCVFSHVLSISSTRVVVYIISFPNQVLL